MCFLHVGAAIYSIVKDPSCGPGSIVKWHNGNPVVIRRPEPYLMTGFQGHRRVGRRRI
jgi:hypothetical protein